MKNLIVYEQFKMNELVTPTSTGNNDNLESILTPFINVGKTILPNGKWEIYSDWGDSDVLDLVVYRKSSVIYLGFECVFNLTKGIFECIPYLKNIKRNKKVVLSDLTLEFEIHQTGSTELLYKYKLKRTILPIFIKTDQELIELYPKLN